MLTEQKKVYSIKKIRLFCNFNSVILKYYSDIQIIISSLTKTKMIKAGYQDVTGSKKLLYLSCTQAYIIISVCARVCEKRERHLFSCTLCAITKGL